jgi:hypothetical protein
MVDLDILRSIPTSTTALGTEYIVMAAVPQPWRDQCWAWLPARRARLIVEGVGPSVLIQDWTAWLNDLTDTTT